MEKFVAWVIKRRKFVMIISGLITLALITQLRSLNVIVDADAVLPQSHPYIVTNNLIEKIFGNRFTVVIAITAKDGNVFKPEILKKVKNITDRLLEIDGVIKNNVISLSSRRAKSISGDEEGMIVKPLMDAVPQTEDEIQKIKSGLAANPVFENLIVSKDGGTTQIVAELKKMPKGMKLINQSVKDAVEPERDDSVEIAISGLPVFLALLEKFSGRIGFLLPIAVLIIGLIHYEAFRTRQALVLPLVTALMAVIWAVGILALTGQPFDVFNSSTPILILAVAAGHAVQILKRYYEEFSTIREQSPTLTPKEMNELAVLRSLTKVGPVMIVACVVAALGFASLMIFEIKTIKVFGIFTAVGIISALILELTFIPAIRSVLKPPGEVEFRREQEQTFWDRILNTFFNWTIKRRRMVYVTTLSLIVILSLGGYWLRIDNSHKNYYYGKVQALLDDDLINERMAGANTMYVLVDGGDADVIKNPSVLRGMESLQRFVETQPEVGKTVSIVDFLKRMNKAMHGDQDEYETLPDSKEMVAQYLLLYSSSGEPGDFDNYIDNDYRRAVIKAYVKTDSTFVISDLIRATEKFAKENFDPSVKLSIGGGTVSTVALNEVLIEEKILNILQIMSAVFLISSLVFRSFFAGLLIIVPVMAAIFVNFGLMGLFSIPLQIATALISAMAVGIGADYGIYLSFRLREELAGSGDEIAAIAKAYRSAGKAILFVASAVAGGYGVLMLSIGFKVHFYMGFLIGTAMLVSAFAALTLMPAMIFTFRPKFIYGQRGTGSKSSKVAGWVLLALVSGWSARSWSQTADEVMTRNFKASKVQDSMASSVFRLINKSGSVRTRETIGYTKLIPGTMDNMRLVVFNAPADVKGTKTLLIEHSGADDDMWVYLPALKKTRRLVSNSKKESFVGTDFSYGDVIGQKVDEWNHKLVKEEMVGDRDCFVIESIAKNPTVIETSGYSKRVSWIEKSNFMMAKAEAYDSSGQLLKRFETKKVKRVDAKNDKWQAMQIEAQNVQTGHRTIIEFKNYKANIGLAKRKIHGSIIGKIGGYMSSTALVMMLVPLCLSTLMWGLGLSLKIDDFVRVKKLKKEVLVGLGIQLILVPLYAVFINWVFGLPAAFALGLILLAASPGGPTANVLSYLAKGNIALNVTLTAINSVLAMAFVPFMVYIGYKMYFGTETVIPVQIGKLMQMILIMIGPMSIGMYMNSKKPHLSKKLEKFMNIFAMVTLVLLSIVGLSGESEYVFSNFFRLAPAVLLFNVGAMAFGWLGSSILGMKADNQVAIIMELGIHNCAFAIGVALSPLLLNSLEMALPSLVYLLFMYLTAVPVAFYFRKKKMGGEEKGEELRRIA